MRQQSSNNAAVNNNNDQLILVLLVQPIDRVPAPRQQFRGGLGPRNMPPFTFRHGSEVRRVARSGFGSEQPAFPFSQENLTELRFDFNLQPEFFRERLCGLLRSYKRGRVDCLDGLRGQASRDLDRLDVAVGCQWRVAVTVF